MKNTRSIQWQEVGTEMTAKVEAKGREFRLDVVDTLIMTGDSGFEWALYEKGKPSAITSGFSRVQEMAMRLAESAVDLIAR